MSSKWVEVIITLTLIKLCFSDEESDILQKIEGKVQVNNGDPDVWLLETTVCLDGGEYYGFLNSSGGFVIHNVPPGSYLMEVFSPNYFFESVHIDISRKNGMICAWKVNWLKPTVVCLPYPLQFQVEKQADFFEERDSWSTLCMLMVSKVHLSIITFYHYFFSYTGSTYNNHLPCSSDGPL